MEPDSRGLACTVSPFFGEDWAPPVHRARRGPVGTSARDRTVLRAGGSRNGPGEQGSAPSSAQLSPIPVSSDPVWRPVAPAGPRGCDLCGSEPLRLRQPHGVKPSQRTPPTPRVWLLRCSAEVLPVLESKWTEGHSWPWGSWPRGDFAMAHHKGNVCYWSPTCPQACCQAQVLGVREGGRRAIAQASSLSPSVLSFSDPDVSWGWRQAPRSRGQDWFRALWTN